MLLNAYEYWRYESKNTQTFEAIEANENLYQSNKVLESSRRHGHSHGAGGVIHNNEENSSFWSAEAWQRVMSSPQYELCVNIVGICNILCIVIRQVDITETTGYIKGWIYIQISINTLFLIELLSDILVHGY